MDWRDIIIHVNHLDPTIGAALKARLKESGKYQPNVRQVVDSSIEEMLEEARETYKIGPAPELCTECGFAPVRFRGAQTCLDCARQSCRDMEDDSWRTRSEGEVAVAYKLECQSEEGESKGYCEACCNSNWISYDHVTAGGHKYPTAEPCPGQAVARRIELFNQARFPGKHHSCSFASFDAFYPGYASIVSRIRDWTTDLRMDMPGQRGLLLEGGHGTGKTHLLVAIGRYLTMDRGIQCRYLDWGDLVAKLGSAMSRDMDQMEVIQPYLDAPVLLLDELGKGKASDWRAEQLETIVDRRYRNEFAVTIAATNYGAKDLGGKVHDRTMSRLAEGVPFLLHGPDYRRI